MRVTTSAVALAALSALKLAWAAYSIMGELSFGHAGRISPEGHTGVPYFELLGTPFKPQILSNKIILTVPAPGVQRSAVWADRALDRRQWQVNVDFRTWGPERAGGNLNIWLVRGGAATVGYSSIYTVGPFDGLALVIDSQSGSGGSIRGFLNDGSTNYVARHSVDELAFGHCPYAYRNLGRLSQLRLTQTADNFQVEIDGRICFESRQVSVPAGNKLGITTATPDSPDSFEIFSLITKASDAANAPAGNSAERPIADRYSSLKAGDPFGDTVPDASPDVFSSSKEQFTDLHNRLQSLSHHVTSNHYIAAQQVQIGDSRHEELSKLLTDMRADLATQLRRIDATDLQKHIDALEVEVRKLRNELHKKVHDSEHSIKGLFTDHQTTVYDMLRRNAPTTHGRLLWVIIISQCILFGAYVLYKRRKETGSKKFI